MPRIIKELPPNRADYTFGDLLSWHLEYGTRPNGDPSRKIGDPWDAGDFAEIIGITFRALRYWIADKHIPDDIDVGKVAQELFGTNPLFDNAKLELWQVVKKTRIRKAALKKAKKAQRAAAANSNEPTPPLTINGDAPPGLASAKQNVSFSDETDAVPVNPSLPDDTDDGEEYDAKTDTWHVPASWKGGAQEKSGKLPQIPRVIVWPRPKRPPINRGSIFVVAVALLLGGYVWTRLPPAASGQKPPASGPQKPDGASTEDAEKERLKAKAEADRLEAARLAKETADRQKKDDETRLAEEKRKADEAQARAKAEGRFQVAAAQEGVTRKKLEDQANAKALNEKLKVLAQADGNDLCAKKLEGLSVPGFALKCDTLIPFGLLLGAVSVTQTASSLADCAARCRKAVSPKCVAFSFDAGAHTGSASCYLTGSIPGYNNATNWIAGTR